MPQQFTPPGMNNAPQPNQNPWAGQQSYNNPYQNPQPTNQQYQNPQQQYNQSEQYGYNNDQQRANDYQSAQTQAVSAYKEPLSKKKIAIFSVGGVFALIVVVMIMVAFSGGNNNTSVTNTTSLCATSGDAELTWRKPILPGQNEDIFDDMISSFESSYSNVDIELEMVEYNDQYYDDLVTDMAKRAGPDIFSIKNDDLPAYQDLMSPINSFTDSRLADYRNNFADLVVRDTMIKDSVYGVSMYVDNLQLYYNDTVLQQNNISIPAQNWADIDKHISTISKVQTDNETFTQYGISLGTGGLLNDQYNIQNFQDIFAMLLMQQGQPIYDYQDQSSALLTSSKNSQSLGQQATEDYLDYADKFSDNYTWNSQSPNNIDAFVEGNLAYFIGYKEDSATIEERNPRLDFGVTALPQLEPGNKQTFGKFFMDGISKAVEYDHAGTAKQYCAEEFLYYLTTVQSDVELDAGAQFATQTSLPSSRKDIINTQLNESDKATQIFASGALYANNYYKPSVKDVENIWYQLTEDIQIRKVDSTEAWNEAVSRYERLIKQGPQIR